MKTKKKILLTGASGLFGVNAIRVGASRYSIIGVYHRHRPTLSGCELIQQDLTQERESSSLVQKIQPDLILHAAANADIDHCELYPEQAYKQNVEATRTLAQCAAELNIPLVYFSTDAFFEGEDHLFTEEDQPTPLNYYGETKLQAEEAIRSLGQNHLIIRTNFFGWTQQGKPNLGEWIVRSLMDNNKIPLFQDVLFSTLFVNTLAETLFDVIDLNQRGILNISGSDPLTKFEFGLRLSDVFRLDRNLIQPSYLRDVSLKASRSTAMPLSVEKLKNLFPHRDFSIQNSIQQFKIFSDQGYTQKLKGIDKTARKSDSRDENS